jgi:hypothetical protein
MGKMTRRNLAKLGVSSRYRWILHRLATVPTAESGFNTQNVFSSNLLTFGSSAIKKQQPFASSGRIDPGSGSESHETLSHKNFQQ